MHVRPARASDLPAIAHLHEANWRREYAGILPQIALGKRLTAFMEEKWQPGYLGQAHVHVAHDDDGELLGFSAMVADDPDGFSFLDNLHVDPSARAMGVGRALMSANAVLALPGPLCLEVLCANKVARTIYRGWGGVEGEPFDDRILGVSVPAVRVDWPDTDALIHRLSGEGQ